MKIDYVKSKPRRKTKKKKKKNSIDRPDDSRFLDSSIDCIRNL